MSKALRTLIATSLAATSIVAASAAGAATTTTNVGVTTNVIANCNVTSTPIAFGNYDALAVTPTTAVGTLVLTCTQGTAPSVAIGLGGNANLGVRRMTDGANFLPYSVFQPASNAASATCTGASVDYPSATPGFALVAAPSLAARTFNLCGQIASGQSVPVGAYADTVLATITF